MLKSSYPRSRPCSPTTSSSPAARSATTWTSSSSSTPTAPGLVRRGRRAHRHRVPDRQPRRRSTATSGPRRPLHVHGLPRGPRGHEPPRRRRQADLDDRAGLEHADDGAQLLPVGEWTGHQAARRHRGAAGRSSSPRPTAASPPTRSSSTALWFGMQDIPGSLHAGGFGLYRARQFAEAGGRRVPRARLRHPARAVRRRGRRQRPGDRGRRAARRHAVRRHDRHRRQGRGLAAAASGSRGSSSTPTASSSARSATATRGSRRGGRRATGSAASTR